MEYHPIESFVVGVGESSTVGQFYRPYQPTVPGPGGYRASPTLPVALQKHKFRFSIYQQGVSHYIADAPPQLMNVFEVDTYVRTLLSKYGCLPGFNLTPSGTQYPPVPNAIPNGCSVNGKQVSVYTEMYTGQIQKFQVLDEALWKCVYWSNNNWNNCPNPLPYR